MLYVSMYLCHWIIVVSVFCVVFRVVFLRCAVFYLDVLSS
jgi:hypothetical protein